MRKSAVWHKADQVFGSSPSSWSHFCCVTFIVLFFFSFFYVGCFTGSPSLLIQGYFLPSLYLSLHKLLLRPWRVRITQITRLWPGWAGLLPVLQHEPRPFRQLSSHIDAVNRLSISSWFVAWTLYISFCFKFTQFDTVGGIEPNS